MLRQVILVIALALSPLATFGQDLDFAPCALTGSGGNGNLHAECATWLRPLDPENADSEQIEIFVAKLRSTSNTPAKDALTLINGGPGGSSIDLMIQFAPLLNAFTRDRDIIVLDQRGTGRSSQLTCPSVADDPENYDPEIVPEIIAACLEELPYDPRFFTTSAAVMDLDALRQALGYDQLTIYGVSYGTRVAMHYMRRYPDKARAVIIDGVVPPSEVLGSQVAIHSQQALDMVLGRCVEEESCFEKFDDSTETFQIVASRLKESPINMVLAHPVTGVQTDIELGYAHLIAWIRFSLYAPEMAALIPIILHEAAYNDNYVPVASNALRLLHNVTTSMAYGMHNAVVCSEDAPFYPMEEVNNEALENTYIGRDMYDTLKSMCDHWPEGYRHEDIKQPLQSDIPTLVLSGEADPITPPTWGDAVMPGLTNALHIIAPGQGHGTIARGCMPQLIQSFVEEPMPRELDASCIDRLKPFPFFLNLLGPNP